MVFWGIDSIFNCMKGFLFLSKVALILNVLFLICLILRYIPFVSSQSLLAVLIIGGWFLSLMVNILHIVWLIVLLLQKELQLTVKSVHFINVAIFIFQLLYFFL